MGEHLVNLVEQVRDLGAPLALDGFAHERGGGHGNGATLAIETQIGDAIVLEFQRDVEPVTAQGVVSVGGRIGRIEPAEEARALVVIQDHIAVEVLEVHQLKTSRAFANADTSASTSDSRE